MSPDIAIRDMALAEECARKRGARNAALLRARRAFATARQQRQPLATCVACHQAQLAGSDEGSGSRVTFTRALLTTTLIGTAAGAGAGAAASYVGPKSSRKMGKRTAAGAGAGALLGALAGVVIGAAYG